MDSLICVGLGQRALMPACFGGREINGAIRVHCGPQGYAFECYCKDWQGGYLSDSSSARWLDAAGNPTARVVGDGVGLVSQHDYYNVILPAIRRLEEMLGG